MWHGDTKQLMSNQITLGGDKFKESKMKYFFAYWQLCQRSLWIFKVYQLFKSNQKNLWKKNSSRAIYPKATISGWRRMLIWGVSSFFLWMLWEFMERGKFPAYLKIGAQLGGNTKTVKLFYLFLLAFSGVC